MNNYKEILNWMFNQFPMYQQQGASAYKKDLSNTILLSNYLGNPEKGLQFIHIAGTNGKGSTSHMLASILQEAGYKVGLYTSPHLKDFKERIKINGEEISEDFVCNFIDDNKFFFENNQLSFFEMTVGLALDYFNKAKVDIVVMEVGMGGRLDSTNIISPLVSVITNIALDHTYFLGDNIASIAYEKGGIIKPFVPVVVGEYVPETKRVFLERAEIEKAKIYFASDLVKTEYASPLLGEYQKQNRKTVLQTVRVLQKQNKLIVNEEQIKDGFANVLINTGFQGRWHQLNDAPKTICDIAHNRHGLEIVLGQVLKEHFDTLHIVLGFVNDKDLNDILPLFPKKARYYFCKPNISRGLDLLILKEKAKQFELNGRIYDSVSEAYKQAYKQSEKTDFIYIGGSTFVVAEIL